MSYHGWKAQWLREIIHTIRGHFRRRRIKKLGYERFSAYFEANGLPYRLSVYLKNVSADQQQLDEVKRNLFRSAISTVEKLQAWDEQ